MPQSYVFSNIERNEYKSLFRFLSSKPLTIKNRKEAETDANGGVLDDDGDAFKRLDEDESDDSDFERYVSAGGVLKYLLSVMF